MKVFPGIVATLIVLASGSVQSAGAKQAMFYGEGTRQCGDWTADYQQSLVTDLSIYPLDEAWVMGYVSAVNDNDPRVPNITATDPSAMSAWMNNYCQQHPLDHIFEGARALVTALVAKQAHP